MREVLQGIEDREDTGVQPIVLGRGDLVPKEGQVEGDHRVDLGLARVCADGLQPFSEDRPVGHTSEGEVITGVRLTVAL